MWGGLADIIQGIASYSKISSAGDNPKMDKRVNNMKQRTGVHIHINNYHSSSSALPAGQPNRHMSGGYQKTGQNQWAKPFGQNSKPCQNSQNQGRVYSQNPNKPFIHSQGQRSFTQGQKPFDGKSNQGNRNAGQNNQGQRRFGNNGYGCSNGSNTNKVIVVKTTKVINKKIIIKKK